MKLGGPVLEYLTVISVEPENNKVEVHISATKRTAGTVGAAQ